MEFELIRQSNEAGEIHSFVYVYIDLMVPIR